MTAQLSLLNAAIVHADTGDDHQWLPGEDVASDIDAVLSHIPGIGHRKNTTRESVRRSLACLYVRPALLPDHERRICEGIAQQVTAYRDARVEAGVVRRTEYVSDGSGGGVVAVPVSAEVWIRLSGERTSEGRWFMRDVTATDRNAVWRLEFRNGDIARPKVKEWRDAVRPYLRTLGCCPSKRNYINLPSLAPLILALRWSDHVAAAVFLAGSGVAPKSDHWTVLVDMALAHGRPWAVPLAELSARHPRDVMSRALVWVHAQGMHRRLRR